MPLAVLTPDSSHILLLLKGWRQQGIQVVNRRTHAVTQTVEQPAAFIGLTFAPDERTVYASGGNTDVVYRYDWNAARLTLRDSLVVRGRPTVKSNDTSYPAGLAISRDGQRLFVAENLADSLAVIDVASGMVVQRLPAGRYPYGVVVGHDDVVYVSSWGTTNVHPYVATAGVLTPLPPIAVARHPSTLLMNADGTRLFVASASTDAISVIDTKTRAVVSTLRDPTPANLGQGSAPMLGLDALSPFDHYGRPLREIWLTAPDVRPYAALVPTVPLTNRNPMRGTGALESRKRDLRYEDVAEEDLFNRILWRAIKGESVSYLGPTRMSAAEIVRSW